MNLYALAFFAVSVVGLEGAGQPAQQCAARTTPEAGIHKRVRDCAPDACLDGGSPLLEYSICMGQSLHCKAVTDQLKLAIQASAQCGCTRMGSEDCASYLATTLTPETLYVRAETVSLSSHRVALLTGISAKDCI
jgi:hypothetical protein